MMPREMVPLSKTTALVWEGQGLREVSKVLPIEVVRGMFGPGYLVDAMAVHRADPLAQYGAVYRVRPL